MVVLSLTIPLSLLAVRSLRDHACRLSRSSNVLSGANRPTKLPPTSDAPLKKSTKRSAAKHRDGSIGRQPSYIDECLGRGIALRRVERYLNVELPVAAHRERARAAPRGTELYESRGDSRLLLEARNPLPDHGGIRGRQ